MVVRLSDDLIRHVLLHCSFDELRALLAVNRQLLELVPSVWRSPAWRADPIHEHHLQRAAWSNDDDDTETVVGAFSGGENRVPGPMHRQRDAIKGVWMDGNRIVVAKYPSHADYERGRILFKVWDVGGASAVVTHTYAHSPSASIEDRYRYIFDASLRGGVLVVLWGREQGHFGDMEVEMFALSSASGAATVDRPAKKDESGFRLVHPALGGWSAKIMKVLWAGPYLLTLAIHPLVGSEPKGTIHLHLWSMQAAVSPLAASSAEHVHSAEVSTYHDMSSFVGLMARFARPCVGLCATASHAMSTRHWQCCGDPTLSLP